MTYSRTIEWAYEEGRSTAAFKEGTKGWDLDRYVTSRLIHMHHWGALEQHLERLAEEGRP